MKYELPAFLIVAAAYSSPVAAADIYVKGPLVSASTSKWSSCYGGVNLGASGASSRQAATTPAYMTGDNMNFPLGFPDGTLNYSSLLNTSFLGGAQIGCRYQTSTHYIFGFEADADFSGHDFTRVSAQATLRRPSRQETASMRTPSGNPHCAGMLVTAGTAGSHT